MQQSGHPRVHISRIGRRRNRRSRSRSSEELCHCVSAERAHVAASLFVFEGKTLSVEFGPKTLRADLNVVRDFKPDGRRLRLCLSQACPPVSEDAKVDDSTTSGVLARDTGFLCGSTLALRWLQAEASTEAPRF